MPRAKKRTRTSNLSNAKSESKMPKLSDEDKPRANEYDFTTAKSYTDLVLRVDGRELHVNRSLLMMASPVFQKIFESDFCEKSKNCIDLPEKNFDDVHLLLQLLVPCSNKKITYDVVLQVYPLADEYQIDEIKKICVDVLIKTAGSFKQSLLDEDDNYQRIIDYKIQDEMTAGKYGMDYTRRGSIDPDRLNITEEMTKTSIWKNLTHETLGENEHNKLNKRRKEHKDKDNKASFYIQDDDGVHHHIGHSGHSGHAGHTGHDGLTEHNGGDDKISKV